MSWEQNYSVPDPTSLISKLTGVTPLGAIMKIARDQGIEIKEIKPIVLVDDIWGKIWGDEIALADGRVFTPVVVKEESWNGNTGMDTYAFHEKGTPEPVIERWSDDVQYQEDSGSEALDPILPDGRRNG